MGKKKLQIFVSSTYLDLIDERQAAVEAILSSKHIPAGMELFRAGNTSQWDTIKRWIDESDIYMLILGGRYGSVEPKSGKSYTQLEYEYAIKKNKPVFSVVLSEQFLFRKAGDLTKEKVFEIENLDKHSKFKEIVMSKMIKLVDDCKDIKLAIKDSISELEEVCELVGWVKSNEGDTGQLLQQLNESRIECSTLRNELGECKKQLTANKMIETLSSGEEKIKLDYLDVMSESYMGSVELTWNELFLLVGKNIYKDGFVSNDQIQQSLEEEISRRDDIDYNAIEVSDTDLIKVQVQLEKLNLIKRDGPKANFTFTEYGKEEFYNKLIERK